MLDIEKISAVNKTFGNAQFNNERASVRICKDTFGLSGEGTRIIGDNIPYSVIDHYSRKKLI